MAEKAKAPAIRFKGFTEDWEQREWVGTVDISTNMVDPKSGDYDELPHVAPGNIESFTGRLFDNVKTVKEENLISGKFHFYPGDVIYGKINPQLGKYVIATFEGLTSADAYVLNAKNGLDQKFLFTLLQTDNFYKYTVSVSKRSGMPKINREELNAYGFSVPKTIEQSQIGSLFLAFDNLITLHQRKLLKLKNVKTAMLEKMFPKNGSNVPEIRFAGFTDAWEQRKLGDLMEISSASRVHKNEWEDAGVPFFRSSDVVAEFKGTDNPKAFISYGLYEELVKKSGRVQKDDVLVTGGGSVGVPYLVKNNEPLYFKDADLIWLKNSGCVNGEFLFTFFTSANFRHYVNSIAHIGTISHYTIEQAQSTPIYLPNKDEQNMIGQFFKHLDNLITLHQRKLKKLQNVKKSMLEKMFV